MATLVDFFVEVYGWSREQAQVQAEKFSQLVEGADLERKTEIGAQFLDWLSVQQLGQD